LGLDIIHNPAFFLVVNHREIVMGWAGVLQGMTG